MDIEQNSEPIKNRKRSWGIAAFVIVVIIALIWLGRELVYPYQTGPKQPIPFSHRIHAGVRGISCLFCHDGANRSPSAGMPEVAKCLLCHNEIAVDFPPIRDLHNYYNRKEPVPWVRVNLLPDYVHFNHEIHLANEVDCGHCHGDVKAMDRIVASQFHMGFCIDCHRSRKATVDCNVCHY